jgi:succinate-semialdehyde dehydrogenase/glutarate-semialdehyde dehydrogenase
VTGELVSYNPSTGEEVGRLPSTPVSEIPALVARARAAQPAWRALGLEERARRIGQVKESLERRADALARLLTQEMGKPLREATGEVRACLAMLGELDEIVDALRTEVLEDSRTRTELHRDPFGVCAVISPWNFPLAMPQQMVIPALVAGNTVVLKPSEETPLVAAAWALSVLELLPADVLQVIHGDGEQGRALVQSDIDMVAFTGSRATGAHILTACGPALKRVVLELGGKDPLVVLHDADLDQAARFAARNSFRNAGQVCVSTERIYVAEPVAEAFVSRLVEQTQKLVVGDGMSDQVDVGPLISARQKAIVTRQVREALARGAKVACGELREGQDNFLQPMVLTDVDHDMALMSEETFGPVVGVMPFRDEDEAVKLANDSPYGLGAVVFGSPERAAAVARRLDAGMIGVNRGVGGATGSPWVGAKQSGYGFHSGKEGHRQFAQVRTVSLPRP